ncbi:MAG: hypothetical protein WC974_06250 [Thermoplasmata archaeon]
MKKIMGLFLGLLMVLTCFASIINISTTGAENSGTSNTNTTPTQTDTTIQTVSGPPNMLIDNMGPIRAEQGDFKIINTEGSVNSTRPVYVRSVQVLRYDVKEGNNHTISFKAVQQEIQQAPSTDAYYSTTVGVDIDKGTRTKTDENVQKTTTPTGTTTTTSPGMGTSVVIPPSQQPTEPKIDTFIFVCPANWTIDAASMNFQFGKLNTEKTILTIEDPTNISINVNPTFKLIKTNNVPVSFDEEKYSGNIMIYALKEIGVLKLILKGELMNFMPGRFQSDVEFRKIVDERFGNKNGMVETTEVEKFINNEGSQIEQHTSEYDTGYNDGYRTGYDEGYKTGYKDGYNDGKVNKEKDYTPDYNPEQNYEEKESLIMMDSLFPEMTSAMVDIVGAEGSISSNDAITMDIILSGKIPIDTTLDRHTVLLMKEFYGPNWEGPAFANVVYTTPDGWRVSPETLPANITPTNDGTTVSFSTNMLKGPCKFVIIYNESAKAPIITKAAGTLYFTMIRINEFNMSVSGMDAVKTLGGEIKTYSDLRSIIDRRGTASMPGFGNGNGVVDAVEVKNFENFVATDMTKGDKAAPKSNEGVPIMIDGKFPELTTQKSFISGAVNTAVTNNDPIQVGIKFVGRYYSEPVDEHKISLYLFRPEAQKDIKFKAVVVAVPSGWVIDSTSKPGVGTLSYSNTVYTIYTNETKEDISFRVIADKSSVTPKLTLENDIVYIIAYPNNTMEMLLTFDMLALMRQKAATDPNSASVTSYSDIRKIIDIAFGNNDGTITANEVARIEEQMFKDQNETKTEQQPGQTQPSQQPTSSGESQNPSNGQGLPIQIDGIMPMIMGVDVEFQNISGSVDSNTSFTANVGVKAMFRMPDRDRYVVAIFDPGMKSDGTSVFSGIVVITAPGWIIDNTTVPSELGTVSLDQRVLEITHNTAGVKFAIMRSTDKSVKNITQVQGKLYIIMDSEGTNDTRIVYLKANGNALVLPVPKTYLEVRREIDSNFGNKDGMITYEELKKYSAEIARRISTGESQQSQSDTSSQNEMPGMKMLVDGSLPMRVESKLKLIGAVGSVTSNDIITADSIILYEFPQKFVPIQTKFVENWSANISTGPVNFVWSGSMAQLPPQMTEFRFDGHALDIVWKDMPYMPYMVPPNGTSTNVSPGQQPPNQPPTQFQNISGYRIYLYEINANMNTYMSNYSPADVSNRVLVAVFNVSNATHNFMLIEPFKKTKIIFRVVALNESGNEGPYGNDVFFDFMAGAGMMPNPKIQFADNTPPTSENLNFDTFVLIVPNGWQIDINSIKPEIRPYVFDYRCIKISKADILAHSLTASSLDMMLIRNESSISPTLGTVTESVYAVIMHTPYSIEQIQTGIDIRKEINVDSYSELRKIIDSVEWAGNGDGYLSNEEVSIFEKMTIDRNVQEKNEGVKDYEVGRKDGYARGFEQGYYAGYATGYNDGKGNKSYETSYGTGYKDDPTAPMVTPPTEEKKEAQTLNEVYTLIPNADFTSIKIVAKQTLDAASVQQIAMAMDMAGNRNEIIEQDEITNFAANLTTIETNTANMTPIMVDGILPVMMKQTPDFSAMLGMNVSAVKAVTITITIELTYTGIPAGETHNIVGNVEQKSATMNIRTESPVGWEIKTINAANFTIDGKNAANATITENDAYRNITIVLNHPVPKFELVDVVFKGGIPTKIVPGDSFEISIKIRNNGTANGSIAVSAFGDTSDWVDLEGKTSTDISIEPGKEISIIGKVSVPTNTSKGNYTVTIVVGNEQEILNFTITAKAAKKESGFAPGFEVAGFAVALVLVALLARRRRK